MRGNHVRCRRRGRKFAALQRVSKSPVPACTLTVHSLYSHCMIVTTVVTGTVPADRNKTAKALYTISKYLHWLDGHYSAFYTECIVQ